MIFLVGMSAKGMPLSFRATPDYEYEGEGLTVNLSFGGVHRDREAFDILSRLAGEAGIAWMRPVGSPLSPWLFDLDAMKREFPGLASLQWCRGRIKVQPEHDVEVGKGSSRPRSKVRFVIRPQDVGQTEDFADFPDLSEPLDSFRLDHPDHERCGLVMMSFDDTPTHRQILDAIRTTCSSLGLNALRADDKRYSPDLFVSVRTYMHGCAFGIGVFEHLSTPAFNPNVALEVGYMIGRRKPVCMLKDDAIPRLPTDVVGKFYEPFSVSDAAGTIPAALERWLRESGIAA